MDSMANLGSRRVYIGVRWLSPLIYIYIWVRGDTQRTPRYTLLDPKLAVESISEVPGASKAHRDVVNRAAPISHLPEFSRAVFSCSYTPSVYVTTFCDMYK